MFMVAMAMVLPWKIFEDFQSFVKTQNFNPHFKNLYLARKWILMSSPWSWLKACFNGYTFCFTTFLVRPYLLEHSKTMNEPQKNNVQMTLKDLSFVNKLKVSFVRIPEDVWPSNLGNCLKMPWDNLSAFFFMPLLEMDDARRVLSLAGFKFFMFIAFKKSNNIMTTQAWRTRQPGDAPVPRHQLARGGQPERRRRDVVHGPRVGSHELLRFGDHVAHGLSGKVEVDRREILGQGQADGAEEHIRVERR